MIITPGFVGIDVSKAWLDVFDGGLGRVERIANEAAALAPLVERWRDGAAFVLFEATGRYDAALRHALATAGLAHAP
jgi:transposase